MTLAASSPTDAPGTAGTRQRHSPFGPAAWLMVAMVATLAVMLVAKGLERLLDCESS